MNVPPLTTIFPLISISGPVEAAGCWTPSRPLSSAFR